MQSESTKTFSGEGAEQYLDFFSVETSLMTFFFLKRAAEEAMTEQEHPIRRINQRLLSAMERANEHGTKIHIIDRPTQKELEHQMFVIAFRSRTSTVSISCGSIFLSDARRCNGDKRSTEQFTNRDIKVPVVDAHDVLDGFLPTPVRGWLLL